MKPLELFNIAWERANHLSGIYQYLNRTATNVLKCDELLRSEWAARVSALDMYVHELISQEMLEIYIGNRPKTDAYKKFSISMNWFEILNASPSSTHSASYFDFVVREQLGRITYQFPDDIADGIRLISKKELWNEVANFIIGGNPAQSVKITEAKSIKTKLRMIVDRRNKIVHEADIKKAQPRELEEISQSDLIEVKQHIERIVRAIDHIVKI